MWKAKVLAELSPIRVEFLRIAAERELPTLDALNELSPPGRLRLGRRRRGRISQGGFDRPGDELIPIGKLPDLLGDLVGEGDDALHQMKLTTEPGGLATARFFKSSPILYGCHVSFRLPEPEVGTV